MKQFAQAAVGSMNGGPSMGAPPAMAPPQAPPQAVPNPLSMMMGMGGPKPQVNRTVSPARKRYGWTRWN